MGYVESTGRGMTNSRTQSRYDKKMKANARTQAARAKEDIRKAREHVQVGPLNQRIIKA